MANPRKLAVSALLKVNNDLAYSNITLNNIFKTSDPTQSEKSLAAALFYGVLDRKITLDYVLGSLIKTPLKKVAPYTLEVLRTGLYQIMFMDRVYESVAVNEAVKLIKSSKESRNSGFVNAVLRNALRMEIVLPNADTPVGISIRYSCPEWIIKSFINDYGIENAVALLEESLKAPHVVIRVNTIKITTDKLLERLKEADINAKKASVDNAVEIKDGIDISKSSLYNSGFFHVQDIASQATSLLLNPKPGEKVLDICAAPGGKSFTMAQLMENKGEIYSCDLYENRVSLINEGAKKLSLKIINPIVNDALVINSDFPVFDAVLCDVPCSGLGILRRKPDIKYKEENDFSNLSDIQFKILSNAACYLKNGGRLVYSTCTLRKAENEDIVESFIKANPDFILLSQKTYMPHKDNTDGFYSALLEKR